MAGQKRKECKECGVHTFRPICGNCGSAELQAVAVSQPAESRRFARRATRDLAETLGTRGLRSHGAF